MTLRPRLAIPIGFFVFALFLGWLGAGLLRMLGLRDGWWVALPLLCFAALQAWAGIRVLRQRTALELHVTPEKFSFGEVSGRQFQVTSVRAYKELRFKGVRIETGSERWVGIPAHVHEPRRVLAAFREHGYPVQD
jgi:hypothetical protein